MSLRSSRIRLNKARISREPPPPPIPLSVSPTKYFLIVYLPIFREGEESEDASLNQEKKTNYNSLA